MAEVALSVPGILVNNIPIGIVPNSFKYKLGKGETNVRFSSSGGGSGQTVHTEDAESKVSMMSWEMYVTDETESLVSGWKSLVGGNAAQAGQPAASPKSMAGASMTNDPEFEASADGKVEIKFEGDPMPNNT